MSRMMDEAKKQIAYFEKTYPGKNQKYVSLETRQNVFGAIVSHAMNSCIEWNKTIVRTISKHSDPKMQAVVMERINASIDANVEVILLLMPYLQSPGYEMVKSKKDMFWFFFEHDTTKYKKEVPQKSEKLYYYRHNNEHFKTYMVLLPTEDGLHKRMTEVVKIENEWMEIIDGKAEKSKFSVDIELKLHTK